MSKLTYIQQEPEEDKIISFDNGVRLLPFAVIEQYLDFLCDYNWSTKKFIHSYTVINNLPSISASIELELSYTLGSSSPLSYIRRTLVGAVTYPLQFFKDINNNSDSDSLGNQHYAASAKSLCIVNAAKSIGKRFGRDLNVLTNALVPGAGITIADDIIDYRLQDEYDIFKDELMINCSSFNEAYHLLLNSKFRDDAALTKIVQTLTYTQPKK